MDMMPGIFVTGCMEPQYVRYVAHNSSGELFVVDSVEKLRGAFTPIDSEDKALDYALAATGYEAYYGQHLDNYNFYLAQTIEDSYSRKTIGGYQVHVFHYAYCSCAPHSTESVDMTASSNGDLIMTNVARAYDDGTHGACVD